jgi:hypothetical protein
VATEVYGVWNDQQVPYHDRRALSVATQIFADAKLTKLVYNGDWNDFRSISRYPVYNKDPKLFTELKAELKTSKELLATTHKAISPSSAVWNDGNHCWRIFRAFEKIPAALQILEIAEVGEAISIPALMALKKLKIAYSGEYPNGCWLKSGLEPQKNVWVEHGYTARQKGGYTITGVMEKRWSSAIVGHCEKLAGPIWTRKLGVDYFGIENGNLSLIAEPGLGDGIYGGVPHSVPQYMDHRQGISILYYDSGQWFPFTLKIRDGKCWWNGRLYRA